METVKDNPTNDMVVTETSHLTIEKPAPFDWAGYFRTREILNTVNLPTVFGPRTGKFSVFGMGH